MNDIDVQLGDYDYLQDMSLEGWAWVFVRRNAAYRKAWQDYLLNSADERSLNETIDSDEEGGEGAKKFGLLFFRKP